MGQGSYVEGIIVWNWVVVFLLRRKIFTKLIIICGGCMIPQHNEGAAKSIRTKHDKSEYWLTCLQEVSVMRDARWSFITCGKGLEFERKVSCWWLARFVTECWLLTWTPKICCCWLRMMLPYFPLLTAVYTDLPHTTRRTIMTQMKGNLTREQKQCTN